VEILPSRQNIKPSSVQGGFLFKGSKGRLESVSGKPAAGDGRRCRHTEIGSSGWNLIVQMKKFMKDLPFSEVNL
jgi:hypothetical protein